MSITYKKSDSSLYVPGAPGVVSFAVYDDLFTYTSGVYTKSANAEFRGNHAVSLVGWGTDAATGVDYWLLQNSWGDTWGDKGFVKIKRGIYVCMYVAIWLSYLLVF